MDDGYVLEDEMLLGPGKGPCKSMNKEGLVAGAIVYDKAKWHYEGDFPSELPKFQAYVHTGMFLGWVIENHLYSEEFQDNCEEEIEAFQNREMTGPQVYKSCDGVFADEMLNSQGNRFARFYFDFDKGDYLRDYEDLLAAGLASTYHVSDTWENYSRLKERIDQRFQAWQNKGKKGTKPSRKKKDA